MIKMKRLLNRMPLLLAIGLSGCLDLGPQGLVLARSASNDGVGFTASMSCHIDSDYDLWVSSSSTVATDTPNPHSGPGALTCYPSNTPFDDGATISVAGDKRQLPEWVEFFWSQPMKRIKDSKTFGEIINHPDHRERVYVRNQIPQRVVDEVRKAGSDPKTGLPNLRLHVYFIWTKEGIKLTWATQRGSEWAPVEYGGYIPKDMDARTIEFLRRGHSRYVPSGE
ncbi:MAG: hypothetical protein ACYCY1_11065 [Sulfuriferula sp.]